MRVHVLLAASFLLSSCVARADVLSPVGSPWPMFRGNLQRTGRSSQVGPTGVTAARWVFQGSDSIDCAPSIGGDGTVYVGDHSGNLYAIRDGKQLWSYNVGGVIGWSSPTVGPDSVVYVGDWWKGTLYAVAPGGMYRWSFAFPSQIDSPATLGPDGLVYLAAFDGQLYALKPSQDAASLVWSFPVSDTGSEIISAPAFSLDGRTLYIGNRNWQLLALDVATHTELWAADLDAEVDATPAVGENGCIYVGTMGGSLYCLTPNGDIKWQFSATAQEGWQAPIKASPALGADGSVYFATQTGRLYRLAGDTGKLMWVWRSETGEAINSSPLVDANGAAFFGSDDGYVYAIGPDGKLMWQFDACHSTGNWVRSAPAMGADGTLYIATTNGKTYAFGGVVAPARAYGDLNGDGRVTVADVTLLLGYLFAGRTLTADQLKLADVAPPSRSGAPAGDGVVDIGDAVRILRRAAGLDGDPWP